VERSRPTILSLSGTHPLSADKTIAALSRELDLTYRTVAANLPSNPGARLEQVDGKDDLKGDTTGQLDEPDSLLKLRVELNAKTAALDCQCYSTRAFRRLGLNILGKQRFL
jgi:hypothetical protein